MKEHLVLHQERKPVYPCKECNKEFHTKTLLSIHGQVHAEKTLSCDICDYKSSRTQSLKMHRQTHLMNRQKYPCDICKREFVSKVHLNTHKKKHAEELHPTSTNTKAEKLTGPK